MSNRPRPIHTAPMDGSTIWATLQDGSKEPIYYRNDDWVKRDGSALHSEPVKWQHLPD